MTRHTSIDIETYSDIDLKKAGLYKYAQSPAFDILLIAWAVDDGPVQIVDLLQDPGTEGASANYQAWLNFLSDFTYPDTIYHAYNAAFENYCLNTWFERIGRGDLVRPLSRWRCTMAHGLYCGYTAGLGATGEAMGLPQDKRKLGIGAALIRKFCVPQRDGKRIKPADEPEKWELFKTYCRQDVETEREIGRRLARWPMPDREQQLWELTCEANIAGVGVDMELVRSAIAIGEKEQERMEAEAREISGLKNPKSVQQLMKWLNEELETDEETEITDLRKTTVTEMIRTGVDSPQAARMLELRQLMSKTSTKKYDALEAATGDDERVRGMMFYYGANRTGRWAGRIVQPQNLPQNHIDSLSFARECVKELDLEMIRVCWGSVPDTLSQLIRTAFVPAKGKIFAIADYSAIEARVVAWLAGETWVLDAFRAGQDIYCATASQMFGVPVEKHGQNAELRQRGKVATLALGYGGGEGALINMGALRMGIPEEDLPDIKARWRQANPAICQLWRLYEDAAIKAVQTKRKQTVPIKIHDPDRARENEERMGAEFGRYSEYFNVGANVTFGVEEDPGTGQEFMTIELPTGRKLFYAHPYLAPAKNFPDRKSLHYYSVDQGTKKWGQTDTWGGKLVENCLASGTLVLTDKGLVPIEMVDDDLLIWDGCEFVSHDGLIDKGIQTTIQVDGLRMTPDHKILTKEGWIKSGESDGLNWAAVSLPDCAVSGTEYPKQESPLAVPMRLWPRSGCGSERSAEQAPSNEILRVHEEPAGQGKQHQTRDVKAPGMGRVALDETALPLTQSSGLSQLWRTWHHSLRRMAGELRELLAGHGPNVSTRLGAGPDRQQQGLLSRKLPMGNPDCECQEQAIKPNHRHPVRPDVGLGIVREDRDRRDDNAIPTGSQLADRITVRGPKLQKRVYDIRNCGPRHRFAVYDPTTQRYRLVSNCTQAIARDCLAETLLRLETIGLTAVFHVHDEVIVEVDRPGQLDMILDIMAEPLDWAPGLPLKGAGFCADYYQKD